MDNYDRYLQQLEIPFESRFVNTSQGPTYVLECGSEGGKPIVLLHGQNANAASWIAWFPVLTPHYRLYAVDVIGGMGKSAPTRPSKKGQAYGKWCIEVLKGLELEGANVLGASQGCWIIVKAAHVDPTMVRSAVLMSPAGFQGISIGQTLRMLPSLLFKPPAEAARATLEMVSAPGVPSDPFFLELFELMLRHFRSEALVPLLSDDELAGLKAPAYLLVGEYEKTMNAYKVLRRALKTLPNLQRAEIVPGVGHGMQHVEPDWVPARVLDFFNSHAS